MIQELAVVNTGVQQAKQRISAFRQRFGDGHFYLACHAALPIVLTPEFLYRLWASFQQDTKGHLLDIPWIAVSDLLLSNLYENVGYELYEMDIIIQNELLSQLQKNDRFGPQRVLEIADFVIAYVEHELEHSDIDIRNLAQTQKLRALAYKKPHEAAYDIALMITQLSFNDKTEWLRIATLLNSLAKPLAVVQPLLDYIRAMSDFARGNLESATAQMNYAVDADTQVKIEGIELPIPDVINARLAKLIKQDVLPSPRTQVLYPGALVIPPVSPLMPTSISLPINPMPLNALGELTRKLAKIAKIIGSVLVLGIVVNIFKSCTPTSPPVRSSPVVNPGTSNNPANTTFQFPMNSCGENISSSGGKLYPVFVQQGHTSLQIVSSRFCRDAYVKYRDTVDRKDIQVASFRNRDRAEELAQILQQSLGTGEVGEVISY